VAVSFRVETRIGAPPAAVFDAARDIDLHVGSQERAGERAVGGVTSGLIGLDEEVSWRARHLGIPFSMTSRVTALEPPDRFVDEQVRGPFRSFWHEHTFRADGDATVMVDAVRFTAPVGPLGWAVERIVLGRYLERLIRDRAEYLRDAVSSPPRP
jgi:ligand-binding SRPBCC domain-containing protein